MMYEIWENLFAILSSLVTKGLAGLVVEMDKPKIQPTVVGNSSRSQLL